MIDKIEKDGDNNNINAVKYYINKRTTFYELWKMVNNTKSCFLADSKKNIKFRLHCT